jgi:hypothetical protein
VLICAGGSACDSGEEAPSHPEEVNVHRNVLVVVTLKGLSSEMDLAEGDIIGCF